MGCGCNKAKNKTAQSPRFDIRHAIRDVTIEKGNEIKKAVTGKEYISRYVDDETKAKRRSICGDPNIHPEANCPTNDRIPELDICGVCKCFINAKIKFKDSFCPRGHWGAIDIDGQERIEVAIPAGVTMPGEDNNG
jgi:hypothetical protein